MGTPWSRQKDHWVQHASEEALNLVVLMMTQEALLDEAPKKYLEAIAWVTSGGVHKTDHGLVEYWAREVGGWKPR